MSVFKLLWSRWKTPFEKEHFVMYDRDPQTFFCEGHNFFLHWCGAAVSLDKNRKKFFRLAVLSAIDCKNRPDTYRRQLWTTPLVIKASECKRAPFRRWTRHKCGIRTRCDGVTCTSYVCATFYKKPPTVVWAVELTWPSSTILTFKRIHQTESAKALFSHFQIVPEDREMDVSAASPLWLRAHSGRKQASSPVLL